MNINNETNIGMNNEKNMNKAEEQNNQCKLLGRRGSGRGIECRGNYWVIGFWMRYGHKYEYKNYNVITVATLIIIKSISIGTCSKYIRNRCVKNPLPSNIFNH